jgi:hypothetical protein
MSLHPYEETFRDLNKKKKQRAKTDAEIAAEMMQQQGYILTQQQGYAHTDL